MLFYRILKKSFPEDCSGRIHGSVWASLSEGMFVPLLQPVKTRLVLTGIFTSNRKAGNLYSLLQGYQTIADQLIRAWLIPERVESTRISFTLAIEEISYDSAFVIISIIFRPCKNNKNPSNWIYSEPNHFRRWCSLHPILNTGLSVSCQLLILFS